MTETIKIGENLEFEVAREKPVEVNFNGHSFKIIDEQYAFFTSPDYMEPELEEGTVCKEALYKFVNFLISTDKDNMPKELKGNVDFALAKPLAELGFEITPDNEEGEKTGVKIEINELWKNLHF